MASELGRSLRECRQDTDQRFNADRALDRLPVSRLSVELAAIRDPIAETSTGHTESIGDRPDDRSDWFVPMHVLMRVDMRRIAPHQPLEPLELAHGLQLDSGR